jgi:WD40 repeat protein
MGSAVGTSPGRLVETDENYNIIHQWPEDTEGLLNILGEQFSPHGLNIDFENNIILTSDFVVPLSVLKPSLGVIGGNTLRLWDLPSRTIINTITKGNGIQDVKFIPGNKESAALASAVGLGQVWIIYPFRKDSSGKQGVAELFLDLGPKAAGKVAVFSDITKDGKTAYFTITTGNHVAQVDISDLNNPKRLDDPDSVHPTIGPHFIKITPDQKHVIIVDYFLQTGEIGIVNTPADFKIHYADINNDGSLEFNRTISFSEQFPERGGGKVSFIPRMSVLQS